MIYMEKKITSQKSSNHTPIVLHEPQPLCTILNRPLCANALGPSRSQNTRDCIRLKNINTESKRVTSDVYIKHSWGMITHVMEPSKTTQPWVHPVTPWAENPRLSHHTQGKNTEIKKVWVYVCMCGCVWKK